MLPNSGAAVPFLVLIGSLALTALVTFYGRRVAQTRDEARFHTAIQRTEEAIQKRVKMYVEPLRAASAFFAGNPEVTAGEFRAFFATLSPGERYPGILGIGFSKRFSAAEKESLERQMRREALPDFVVWPAAERAEYHAVLYLEPLDRRNRAAIGFDMFTEPVRRAAMERARNTAEAAASGKVTLQQDIESDAQSGFLIYLPVYRGGKAPANTAERRTNLLGLVFSPWRMGDLLDRIFNEENNPGVDFSVAIGDQSGANETLFQSALSTGERAKQSRHRLSKSIVVAGQPWMLSFQTNEQFEQISSHSAVPWLCLSGIVISLALFGFTYAQARARSALEKRAEELRRSKALLEESEGRFRSMADHAPVLIWLADIKGAGTYFNRPWLDFTGRVLEQELGYGWTEGIHPEDRSEFLRTCAEASAGHKAWKIEHRLRRFDGEYRWMLNHGVPLVSTEGNFSGYIGSCVDITDRKASEEAIQRLNAELEERVAARTAALRESNEQMEAFTYSVAHDLRAPLRAMQGFGAALLEDYAPQLDGKAADFARRIMLSAQRMDTLIQDLLAYSRLTRAPLALDKVKLDKIVATVLPLFESEIKSRQAIISLEGPMPQVTGHAGTLETIFTNLISNALKFVRAGVPPQVRIWAEDRGALVRVWVEDNGIGISREYRDRIFKVFERLHGVEEYPGTGIGLALVRKGVERMGGSAGLSSEVGEGSCFWIELPK